MAVRIPRCPGSAWGGALPAPGVPITTPTAPGLSFFIGLGVNAVFAGILWAQKRDLPPDARRFADAAPSLRTPEQHLKDLIESLEFEIERLKRSDDPLDQDRARILRGVVESLQLAMGPPVIAQKEAVAPHTAVNSADPVGSTSTGAMETGAEAAEDDHLRPLPVSGKELVALIQARRPVEGHLDSIVKSRCLLSDSIFLLPGGILLIEILEDLGKEALRQLAKITDHRKFLTALAMHLDSRNWKPFADQIRYVLDRRGDRIDAAPKYHYHEAREAPERGALPPSLSRQNYVNFKGLSETIASDYSPLREADTFSSMNVLIAWAVAHRGEITALFIGNHGLSEGLVVSLATIVSAAFKAQKITCNKLSIQTQATYTEIAMQYWGDIDQSKLTIYGGLSNVALDMYKNWNSRWPSRKRLGLFTIQKVLRVARQIYRGDIRIPGLTRDTGMDHPQNLTTPANPL